MIFAIAIGVATFLIYQFIAASTLSEVDEILTAEVIEFRNLLAKAGVTGLATAMVDEANEIGSTRIYFKLHSNSKPEIDTSDLTDWQGLPNFNRGPSSLVSYKTIYLSTKKSGVRIGYFPLSSDLILEVGQSLADKEAHLRDYLRFLTSLAASATLFSMLFGYLIVRKAMKRVDNLTSLALSVTETNLTNRVPVTGMNDEIERLAMTLNSMLDRIGFLVISLKKVIDDLSHELRTPLTRMRIEAELLLRSDVSKTQWVDFGQSTIEEVDRLVGTIGSILEISEAENRITKFNFTRFDIAELVKDTCYLFETVAGEKGVEITVEGLSTCEIIGDRRQLERVFSNLVDNAIKYSHANGKVEIITDENLESVKIQISDSGIGMEKLDLPFIFNRFFRAKNSAEYPGNGLGLSLVKAIVEAHDGEISANLNSGSGCSFKLTLPKLQKQES